MKRWEEIWKKCKKSYYARLRKKGFLYIGMLVWITLCCFFRRLFTVSPCLKRHRAVASLCMIVIVSALLFHVSHSLMKTEENHLTLQVQQKTEELEEGYEDDISHGIILVNDGENELTGVELNLDGDPGVSLDIEDGKKSEKTLAPGEKWNVTLKMKPGKKAGKYYVTVVASATELEETVEQTIRFVVRAGATPEPTVIPETPEPTVIPGTPEATETPKPVETPEATEIPVVTGTPEVTEIPVVTGTPEVTVIPEVTATPEMTVIPEPTVTPGATEIPGLVGTPVATVIPEATEIPGLAGTPVATVIPVVTEIPKPFGTPVATQTPEKAGAIPSEASQSPSTATEAAQANAEAQSDVSATENDEIIRVTLPGHMTLKMNPFASDKNSQIISEQYPITNESGFPLNVEVTKAVVDIQQNAGFMQKNCSLGIDFLQNDAVLLAIRNLREGVNQINTSFLLSSGANTYIRIFGSVDEGTEGLWEDGDLHANIVFRFSAGENR